MKPKDDPTSIGAILVAMGVISESQLIEAVEEQHTTRFDVMLGKLLLANGLISAAQLETALKSQHDLRSGKKHRRAVAQARIAEQGVHAVISMASLLRENSKETRDKVTGTAFPKVTDGMLGKKADGSNS